ncbi:hypothetical protein ABIB25_000384 [Nakamurella sp. UYEF19]|uniref:DUF5685 family protein n=1 Tax=Nakamurella sp. UYEF19 TaxID=1756392 RepID=UPI0033920C75
MFGLIAPCRHHLDDQLHRQWQAHLCGLCLSLRDRHGQLSRVTTNTDAVMTSVLLQAQRSIAASTVTAGPCPLRGMRTATVIAPAELSARFAGTASLTLAAAKAADVLQEKRSGVNSAHPVRSAAAAGLAGGLRRRALADRAMSTSIDAPGMLADLARQADLELTTRPGDSLLAVTAPSAIAAGTIFAATADLAEAPANAGALREIGEAYGALAHVMDAAEDLDRDARAGDFNPLTATGHTLADARALCRQLADTIRNGLSRLQLTDDRLIRILLVDAVHAAVHRVFDPRVLDATASWEPAAPGGRPIAGHPGHPPAAPGDPPPGPGGSRSFWRNVLPWVGVYCTGYALCASHDNPCTGRRHEPGCTNCNCDGSCCDCCDGGCCDCCDCSSTHHADPPPTAGPTDQPTGHPSPPSGRDTLQG